MRFMIVAMHSVNIIVVCVIGFCRYSVTRVTILSLTAITSSGRLSMGQPTYVFFFFQAKDGIRDVAVTGVQTCALPIPLRNADRRELEGHVQVFLAEKYFEGCARLAITDQIRVLIAAQACILLLHRDTDYRSEEHTSELQSRLHLVCRLLLEKKKKAQLPARRRPPLDRARRRPHPPHRGYRRTLCRSRARTRPAVRVHLAVGHPHHPSRRRPD